MNAYSRPNVKYSGLLLMLAMLLVFAGCSSNEKTDVMFECASPSGAKVATFYRVSTGSGPGDQEMKLNIRPADKSFDAGMQSFSFRHGYDAIIHWQSESAMRVEYPQGSEVTNQENAIFGTSQTFSSTDTIQITYSELPSTHGYFMVEQRCFK